MKLKVDWQIKDIETELYQELVRYIKYDNKTMITYRINEQIKEKFPDIKIKCNLNSFGTTQCVYGEIYYMKKDKGSNTDVINAIKDILSTIKPIYKDLIEFKDDDADRDEINRRQRR